MIGLIDIDGKLPNLALMKISSYYKAMGEQVDYIAYLIFNKNNQKCKEN